MLGGEVSLQSPHRAERGASKLGQGWTDGRTVDGERPVVLLMLLLFISAGPQPEHRTCGFNLLCLSFPHAGMMKRPTCFTDSLVSE